MVGLFVYFFCQWMQNVQRLKNNRLAASSQNGNLGLNVFRFVVAGWRQGDVDDVIDLFFFFQLASQIVATCKIVNSSYRNKIASSRLASVHNTSDVYLNAFVANPPLRQADRRESSTRADCPPGPPKLLHCFQSNEKIHLCWLELI